MSNVANQPDLSQSQNNSRLDGGKNTKTVNDTAKNQELLKTNSITISDASHLPPTPSSASPRRPELKSETRQLDIPTPPPLPNQTPQSQPTTPPSSSRRDPDVAAALESFSVFNASTELKDFRDAMVQQGIIHADEFVKINTNADMEAFLLKLVAWKAKAAGATAAEIQDAKDRITKAYDAIQMGK